MRSTAALSADREAQNVEPSDREIHEPRKPTCELYHPESKNLPALEDHQSIQETLAASELATKKWTDLVSEGNRHFSKLHTDVEEGIESRNNFL